jgi:hypothetical protein
MQIQEIERNVMASGHLSARLLGPHRSLLVLFSLISSTILLSSPVVADVSRDEQKAYEALVKAVGKEGGFHHPSIGLVAPAPSGAPRGIGIVKSIKKKFANDVLVLVPYSYQLTRQTALSTLTPLIPPIVLADLPLIELDDAALLVLLLIHEYGLGKKSKFHAYLNTLPVQSGGGCGWGEIDDFRSLPNGVEIEDLESAINYSYRVSNGLANDYAEYLSQVSWRKEWKKNPNLALQWSLCIVSSRGTAANQYPGDDSYSGVRLVPLADLANHQLISGGYFELSGKERITKGDFMDASPDDAGAFILRSIWKDHTHKDLSLGDEITVNYNLPEYRVADWFLSLGFVPPELTIIGNEEL